MMNQEEMIKGEFEQACEAPQVTPMLLELDLHRITITDQLPEEEFLFKLNGVPCFPRKELSAVTGQAKSGKTFFTSMLMACAVKQQVLAIERIRKEPLRVMWFDTEQSKRSTQEILCNRVMKLCAEATSSEETDGKSHPGGDEENFFVFNVRGKSCEERIDLLTEGIMAYQPDLVILDGVRDLVRDINDGVKATELIERLMQLAEEAKCCIVCVLHQNRSTDNRGLRGWLGTELMNKVFEVYACEKLRQQGVFCVEQTHTRKYGIEEALYYTVDDNGLPVQTERPNIQPRDAQGKFTSYDSREGAESLNSEYIISHENSEWEWDLQRLFRDAMGNRASWGYKDLMKEVMRLSHIKWNQHYYKLLAKAEEQRIVKKTLDRCGRVVIMNVPNGGSVA